ncbi:hypothetical protein AGMMS50229_01010 [Campylobacterota bacterium]|nr:hypothetical protein AGMMS50229_01010 [Campylobacterota bacterium]
MVFAGLIERLDKRERLRFILTRSLWSAADRRFRLIAVIAVFAVAFAMSFMLNIGKLPHWEFAGDSSSYIKYDYSDPWASARSPGTPFYFDLVADRDTIVSELRAYDELPTPQNATPVLDKELRKINLANIVILSLGVALLTIALCCYLSAAFAVIAAFAAAHGTGLSYFVASILSEPPVIFITLAFGACLLIYIKTRCFSLLPIISALAVAGFLVRPAGIFLIAVASLLIAFDLWKKRSLLKSTILAICLIVGAAAFPIQLYMTTGIVTLGQLNMTKLMFALFLAEPSDIDRMPTSEMKADLTRFFELKPSAINAMNGSTNKYANSPLAPQAFREDWNGWENLPLVPRYIYSVNQFGWAVFQNTIYADRFKTRSPQETYRYYQGIADAILSAHQFELAQLRAANFLSGFSAYGYIGFGASPINTIARRLHLPAILIYPAIFALILIALWRGARVFALPITALVGTHLLAIAALSIGHCVMTRYSVVSEWMITLAVMLSFASLIQAYYSYFARRNNARN